MCVIVVKIVQVANADSPASIRIPAFYFNDAIEGTPDREPMAGENICALMCSSAAPASTCSPSAVVGIISAHRHGKGVLEQVQLAKRFIDTGKLLNAL